jgi:hypothetical protein
MELLANPSLAIRSDLVTESTDLLAAMLDDIEAVEPVDLKGQAIVPDWIADWRILIQDRYNYSDRLQAALPRAVRLSSYRPSRARAV